MISCCNENFTLSVGATGANILGGSGNDTFVVSAASLQTLSTIGGGAGKDSVSFAGAMSGGTVLGGSDNDTLNFSAGVDNDAYVSGDAGSDLLLFSSTISSWHLRIWWRRQHGHQGCYFR